ncbi:MAG: tRNA (adenosine(37)-N6)-threonylcarbamoyltransferase complex transferase subunit TsaD [Verrucomicrobiales bacterium]
MIEPKELPRAALLRGNERPSFIRGNMLVLAIESSCDETSAAVVRDGIVLSNIVSSQAKLHEEYGGVVPELATREHLKNFLPVAREALAAAQVSIEQLNAIAATQGPGLPSALMTGFQAAQTISMVSNKPFYGIHHHEAHLYSPWIGGNPPRAQFDLFEPSVSLIVSGGHTVLVHVQGELQHKVLGSTVDDAAGECFDKAAKLMGLPYPGGPVLDKLAAAGDPTLIKFPRPMLKDPNDDFSFSGLKTAVRYHIRDNPQSIENKCDLQNLCAAVQSAIVEVLVQKTIRAARRLKLKCITASGGVTCNSGLRRELEAACKRHQLKLRLADRSLCTDNAAMIAILAERKIIHNHPPTLLDAEIKPSWSL